MNDEYHDITQCFIGSGCTTLFWKDVWSNGELLYDKFPHLFQHVLDEDVTIVAMASTPKHYLMFCVASLQ
jgi:hypothetical protein